MPDTKGKTIIPVAIVLLLCSTWMMALNTGLAHAATRTVTQVKDTSYPIPVAVYIEAEKPEPTVNTIVIDRPVYIEKEIVIPREVPVTLKDWDSRQQLAEFLKNDDTDQRLVLQADNSGGITFNGQCEDLALQLRDRAMAIGRYLSVQVLNPMEYEKWYGLPVRSDVYHAICMARIGNEFWYIEPDTDKCWLALYLD